MTCPQCGSESMTWLGYVNQSNWYRCMACGWQERVEIDKNGCKETIIESEADNADN